MTDDLIRMEMVAILEEKGIAEGAYAMEIAEELAPVALRARRPTLDTTGWLIPNVVEADEDELVIADDAES